MTEVKLSVEQLRAIAFAKSAQEVTEICQGNWRPPNIEEQIALQQLQDGKKTPVMPQKQFLGVNSDGHLILNPNVSEEKNND